MFSPSGSSRALARFAAKSCAAPRRTVPGLRAGFERLDNACESYPGRRVKRAYSLHPASGGLRTLAWTVYTAVLPNSRRGRRATRGTGLPFSAYTDPLIRLVHAQADRAALCRQYTGPSVHHLSARQYAPLSDVGCITFGEERHPQHRSPATERHRRRTTWTSQQKDASRHFVVLRAGVEARAKENWYPVVEDPRRKRAFMSHNTNRGSLALLNA
ncbi:hypothetical protein GE09DRAFT_1154417 [Coniochaeta sp. 2T2.1]|nr:hypothetical protein GE09DRAFT_1154417 [Coniochaeta sp. 2T2.1]